MRGSVVRGAGERCVDPLRPAVGQLNGSKELLLETLGGVLVELLVGLAEIRQGDADLVGGRGERVE